MSKTDKTRPYWVRCNDPSEPRYISHSCENFRFGSPRGCDFVEHYASARDYQMRRCGWHLKWWVRSPYCPSPSKAWRHVDYWESERHAVRRATARAAREWNSFGDDSDVDIPTDQHHHMPYGGGWWD